jgi:hypothetical protein
MMRRDPQVIRLGSDVAYDATNVLTWILALLLTAAGAWQAGLAVAGLKALSSGRLSAKQDAYARRPARTDFSGGGGVPGRALCRLASADFCGRKERESLAMVEPERGATASREALRGADVRRC